MILLGITNVRGNSDQSISSYVENGAILDAGLFVQDSDTKNTVKLSADGTIVTGITAVKKVICPDLSDLKDSCQTIYTKSLDIGVQFVETSGGIHGSPVWVDGNGTGKATLTDPAVGGSKPIGTLLSEIGSATDGISEQDSQGNPFYGAYIRFLDGKTELISLT